MLLNRVVPILLLRNGGLVKTLRFKKPVYVGDPTNAVRIFNEKQVDELALLDIHATREGRRPDLDQVRMVASECFMPLSYGGGVGSLSDAKQLFTAGVEKVVLRSRAAIDLAVVSDIADFAGSQSVAVSVDVRRGRLGGLRLHAPGTPRDGSGSWLEYLHDAVAAGAGEIVLNAVHRDGTMSGLDLDLVSRAARDLSVPLLAVGGVGSLSDIRDGIAAGASAVGAGAFFVFNGPRRAVLITYPPYEELRMVLESARADA